MAGFLIYLPGERGSHPDVLRKVGLGELLAPDDAGPMFFDVIAGGPDGSTGKGVLWEHDDASRRPARTINLETQEWHPAKACGDLPAGRFWLGRERSRPVRPEDLERKVMHPGADVILEDRQAWHVPIARQLPRVLGLTDDGQVGGRVKDAYRDFYHAAWSIFDLFGLTPEGMAIVPEREGYEFCAQALSINYRVNRDVCDFLGLIGTAALVAIPKAVIEMEELIEWLEKKNAEAASQPIAAGATA